jgi:type II secretory pathway component PulM
MPSTTTLILGGALLLIAIIFLYLWQNAEARVRKHKKHIRELQDK